jgi:hypothetical protein
MIKEKINIPEDNIMIAATHTHSGPGPVTSFPSQKTLP